MLARGECLDLSRGVSVFLPISRGEKAYWDLLIRFIEVVFMQDEEFERPVWQRDIEYRS